MRIQQRLLVAALAFSVLPTACKKEEEADPVDLGYDYFPTKIGTWVEYQVDSLWRDDTLGILDSVSYRLLERIEENYTDPEGRPSQRIRRYVKDQDDNWVVRDVWTRTLTTTAAEMTEENKRRLKLSFPVRTSRTWDVNAYNADDDLLVSCRDIDKPLQLAGLYFDRTVLVKNTVPANIIDKRNFEERYARGVGMVSKYWEETNTQYPQGSPVIRGWRLDMMAVAHGVD